MADNCFPTPPASPETPTPSQRMTTGGKGLQPSLDVTYAPKKPRMSAMHLANMIIQNHEDQMALLNDIHTLSRRDFLARLREE